jgi:hypothetical protein
VLHLNNFGVLLFKSKITRGLVGNAINGPILTGPTRAILATCSMESTVYSCLIGWLA